MKALRTFSTTEINLPVWALCLCIDGTIIECPNEVETAENPKIPENLKTVLS